MKRFIPTLVLLLLALFSPNVRAQMIVHYINVGQADAILIELPNARCQALPKPLERRCGAVVLIDAGEENTFDPKLRGHLMSYLKTFFGERPLLRNTIDAVIITHPHLDHTGKLPEVVQTFTVRNLIDGGGGVELDKRDLPESNSGLQALELARRIVKKKGGNYRDVTDLRLPRLVFPIFAALRAADPNVGFRLLSGSRKCEDANNDSLVLLVGYKDHRFLFAGDALSRADYECSDEISSLIAKYGDSGWLKADVLKVSHHGSASGISRDWLSTIRPMYSIISAGQSDAAHRGPGEFHAWQFGHPRESTVRMLQEWTRGFRPSLKDVVTMSSPKKESLVSLKNGVYCTCWDGDIKVFTDGKTLSVRVNETVIAARDIWGSLFWEQVPPLSPHNKRVAEFDLLFQ